MCSWKFSATEFRFLKELVLNIQIVNSFPTILNIIHIIHSFISVNKTTHVNNCSYIHFQMDKEDDIFSSFFDIFIITKLNKGKVNKTKHLSLLVISYLYHKLNTITYNLFYDINLAVNLANTIWKNSFYLYNIRIFKWVKLNQTNIKSRYHTINGPYYPPTLHMLKEF